jgi:hypothetical protein
VHLLFGITGVIGRFKQRSLEEWPIKVHCE